MIVHVVGYRARPRWLATAGCGIAFGLVAASPARAAATTPARCDAPAIQRMVATDVHIDEAKTVEANGDLPAHCAVKGSILHGSKIGFAAALPADWNEKFLFYGIGGFAGVINPLDRPPSDQGLKRGYATATTDTGHQSPTVENATWALDNPAAVLNHFESSVDLSAQTVKSLIASYYGRAPDRSYFQGCSAGGRQAMVEAERFPSTFDGIIAEAPVWNYSALLSTFLLNGQRILRSPANWVSPENFEAIDREVLRQCDLLDGVADAIIMDPRQCRPNLHTIVCKAGQSGTDCLTAAQLATIKQLTQPANPGVPGYYGYYLTGTDRSGPFFGWPDWMFGTRPTMLDSSGRLQFASRVLAGSKDQGRGPLQFLLGEQFFRYMVMNDPTYDGRDFRFERDMAVLQSKLGAFLDAKDTNIGTFVRSGGKLLIWQGWSDGAVPAGMAIDLYERIGHDTPVHHGEKQLDQSVRLFMVPGVQHCSWGTGLTEFDALGALERWVEQDRAPERIEATQLVDGKPARSRPLCPYPKVAHFLGRGDPDEAQSFDCR
jgi:feruloyl esterase